MTTDRTTQVLAEVVAHQQIDDAFVTQITTEVLAPQLVQGALVTQVTLEVISHHRGKLRHRQRDDDWRVNAGKNQQTSRWDSPIRRGKPNTYI